MQRLLVPMGASGIFKDADKAAMTKLSDTVCKGKKRKAVAVAPEETEGGGRSNGRGNKGKGKGKGGKAGKAKRQAKSKAAPPADASVVSTVTSEFIPGQSCQISSMRHVNGLSVSP